MKQLLEKIDLALDEASRPCIATYGPGDVEVEASLDQHAKLLEHLWAARRLADNPKLRTHMDALREIADGLAMLRNDAEVGDEPAAEEWVVTKIDYYTAALDNLLDQIDPEVQ